MKNRIREFRKAKGMTQEQLAISIGKVKSAISKLENGNADISGLILESIARALDCRPTDLIDDGSEKIAPDEIMILKKYRGLSERDRMKFVSMADMFLDVDKKLKSPTK
ncbi:MAG: helix-turn-helix domain-containing protein [Alphaproteobacteria bacterium]